LTRLASPSVNRVEGYVGGTNENAPPASSKSVDGVGTVDAAQNLFATGPGKLAVRGGSQVKRTLTCDRALYLRPYTPTGAVAMAHANGSTNHRIWRLTSDLAFVTGTEATSRHDPGASWNKVTPARPIGTELFEKLFVADATVDYATRSGLFAMDASGTITAVSFDLGGGSEQLKPYVAEEYNNHLFVAGYENKTLSNDSPSILRHSYLGVSPEAAGGFDPLAYNFIGAKGQRITGLKKGRGLLLVAKANEIYRVSGFGIAKPGWTFAVEAVEGTQGMGVSNPYAFCYAGGADADGKGYWYGIGESGPFRSDGYSCESLVPARRRSWKTITNLAYSWVQYHPDREVVLFGMNQTPVPTGRSATYPTVIWVWDCQREIWISDIKMSADVMYAYAVPSTTSQAPLVAPSALAFTHASSTLTTVAATWTNGDASANTEIWVRDNATGASTLWTTAAPGATSATITGLVQGTHYKVRIRHTRSGITTDFTGELDAYTLLPAPTSITRYHIPTTTTAFISVSVPVGTATRVYLRRDGIDVADQAVTAPAAYQFANSGLSAGITYAFTARIRSTDWPAAIEYSAFSSAFNETTAG
jgi:hypothetical protein